MACVVCFSQIGILRRSVRVEGRITSLALEPPFWRILDRMARERGGGTLTSLLSDLQRLRRSEGSSNFSSYLRIVCLRYVALQGWTLDQELSPP